MAEDSIKGDLRCREFSVARKVKTLDRAIADEGPIDVLAITHPSTSTEFFVGFTQEDSGRLGMFRWGTSAGGRAPVQGGNRKHVE